MHPAEQLIGDPAWPCGLNQITRPFGVSPGSEVSNSVSTETSGRRCVVGHGVWNLRQFGRVLTRNRSVPFVAVYVTNGKMAQERRREDVIPVQPVHPGIFRIGGARGTQHHRQGASFIRLRLLTPDCHVHVILFAPVIVGACESRCHSIRGSSRSLTSHRRRSPAAPRRGRIVQPAGIIYARRNELPAARKDFAEAVRLNPDLTVGWQNLARACQLTPDVNSLEYTADAWQRVLRLKPGDECAARISAVRSRLRASSLSPGPSA
jgi:hypothetical protein